MELEGLNDAISLCVRFHCESFDKSQMGSRHLCSIICLFFLQFGKSTAADYSPSVEAEETEALIALLGLDSGVSEGRDYAMSFDADADAGIHSKSV